MAFVEQGFVINYEIKKIDGIRGIVRGEINGNKYEPSVEFRSNNIEQVDDPVMGLVDREMSIFFKVYCENDDQIKQFNYFLRNIQKEHKTITIPGAVPTDAGKSQKNVKSLLKAGELMQMYQKQEKK